MWARSLFRISVFAVSHPCTPNRSLDGNPCTKRRSDLTPRAVRDLRGGAGGTPRVFPRSASKHTHTHTQDVSRTVAQTPRKPRDSEGNHLFWEHEIIVDLPENTRHRTFAIRPPPRCTRLAVIASPKPARITVAVAEPIFSDAEHGEDPSVTPLPPQSQISADRPVTIG